MQDIDHRDAAESTVGERQAPGTDDQINPGEFQDVRSDQSRDEVPHESAAGTDFQYRVVSAWERRGDAPVPVDVDGLEERLFSDNPPP